ncbi:MULTISPECIES: pyridoxal-phosphate dependent enzyme [Aerococcus]|uniref:cysteine synthase n=1 Tax=Aerococcus sanguinicola TaxID=119206 RepID=A0A5N1GN88_9LACT|nr:MULTISPECIES: pyridoxal-phosphate dependent enzyme [Aerococcus]KAA9302435.1 pyridoxal-phosphate dependent enzyme [Aerococcus sanguinicola]MDK6369809.1 pyridoxal-phosphate dependent enzyme [Aerococcus sp. UMB9870]MDK6680449.1 pyridoxal-phosphate dependent enzyme [Aerococcus sp. UMB8608]MDK6687054.1 pyridoxal-phosphate dependent enzyme [Aerococcus sp. UMB8623]MDK6940273.1 pyridoxal-phosphate dependent enzyme [Aerococcus sp. UMB8487]
MPAVAKDLSQLITGTPLVKLQRSTPYRAADVYLKLENRNLTGSGRDRAALNMLEVKEAEGAFNEKRAFVGIDDGYFGLSLASLAAVRGFDAVIFRSQAWCSELADKMRALGAQVEDLDDQLSFTDQIEAAKTYALSHDLPFLDPFSDLANPSIHAVTTGPEIIEALGRVPDAFVAGVGTGGTLTGVAQALRDQEEGVGIYAVEPAQAAVLSGESAGQHHLSGIGYGFIPASLDRACFDQVIVVDELKALHCQRALAINEGLLVDSGSGAAVAGAIALAERLGQDRQVVVSVTARFDAR